MNIRPLPEAELREVFLRGRLAFSEGKPLGRPGAGRYLARSQRQFCL